jgi:flagellar biosynthesis activator protein FlaF
MSQCAALQIKPEVDKLQALIDINRNIAAGLNGRV